jgi:hypothetical protein
VDYRRFDQIARTLSTFQSRRGLLRALGFGALLLPGTASARNKKKRKKKPKFNDFGCVNFGGYCKSNNQCCSGICEGKEGKKRCGAHDFSTCQAGQNACDDAVAAPCVSSTGANRAACDTTTGNAPYCSADGDCFDCRKDADCVPFCGERAACIKCAACAEEGVVTACVGPTVDGCSFPP